MKKVILHLLYIPLNSNKAFNLTQISVRLLGGCATLSQKSPQNFRRLTRRYASEGFEVLPQGSTIRIARPTDNLQEIAEQYSTGLGFKVLGSFEDHDGFNGIMIGHDLQPYHLEFTHHIGTEVGRAPTQDNLLVFYIPDSDQWAATCASMSSAGFKEVVSYNPYWDRIGKTFEDLDGYRVVLQNA